jgi:uncharacterized protein DUF1569
VKTLANTHDREELLRRLRSVRSDTIPKWGRMSAHQMICHLADAFRMATGEKAVSEASGLLHRTLVKWLVLYVPLAWPAGIPTRPELDQTLGGTKPLDFARDVSQVESLLEKTAANRSIVWSAHPIFGPMSQSAWLRWAYLHTDHHLRQFGA